jgi:hypothetical protein
MLWCTRKACPQAAGDVSILASTLPNPTVKDMQEMNATLRRLQQSVDVPIRIRPIPLNRLTGLVFTDASLGNAEGHKSQLAYLACCADVSIQKGAEADISILCWKSHKMSRAASNVLFTEANAMSDGLAFMEWMSTWLGLAKDLEYDMRKRAENNREIQLNCIMPDPEQLHNVIGVTDSKSMYDNLNREQFTGAEKRSALEIAVIRDSLHTMDGKVSWVPHEKNCVDCLTKVKGNAEALLDLMKKAKYRLVAEKDELKARAEFRAQTGKANPRAKRSGVAYEHPPSPYDKLEQQETYVSHAPPRG